jgi:hypothetical protein
METSNEPPKKKYKDIYSRIVEKRKELMAEKDERIKLEEEEKRRREEEKREEDENHEDIHGKYKIK